MAKERVNEFNFRIFSVWLPSEMYYKKFYNMVFDVHSENVLFSGFFFIKSYCDLKLFISYVFVKKLEL